MPLNWPTGIATRSALVMSLVLAGCGGDASNQHSESNSALLPSQSTAVKSRHDINSLRLNQVQYIGTHNSYHIAPEPEVTALVHQLNGKKANKIDGLDYTHPSLPDQLALGIRHFEIDIYRDTQGGTFAKPLALEMLKQQGNVNLKPYDTEGVLNQPGFKVIHVADYDVHSRCLVFRECLEQIKAWSDQHPNEAPVMIQLEAKDSGESIDNYTTAKPEPFSGQVWAELAAEIVSVFPLERIITPNDIRGNYQTLNEAVLNQNWPTLKEAAGKIMFMLDNTNEVMESYLTEVPDLDKRLIFVSVEPGHPSAAWIKMNSPEDSRIPERVKRGYLIRTRADSGTRESRNNDTTTRERAFASGAQFISTDYPTPDVRFSDYEVKFDNGTYVRCNAISQPQSCQ